jgi:hypothetical protein
MERLSEKYEVSLVGHQGAMEDLVFKILAESVSIGRQTTNDIVLDDPTVSGEHARIDYDGIAFEILDLGSRGGVRVNGRPIQQTEIRDGDRIRIGKTTFIFSVQPRGGGSAASELAAAAAPQLDAASRLRILIYGCISLVMLIFILMSLGDPADPKSGSGGQDLAALADIGPLAIESFELLTHRPDAEQARQASLHLQRGLIELDAGDYIKAIEELKAALRNNPTCDACKAQLEWTFEQLRRRISYHYLAGEDDFRNMRYASAVRHWQVTKNLLGPEDALAGDLEKKIALAGQKESELEWRSVGLP